MYWLFKDQDFNRPSDHLKFVSVFSLCRTGGRNGQRLKGRRSTEKRGIYARKMRKSCSSGAYFLIPTSTRSMLLYGTDQELELRSNSFSSLLYDVLHRGFLFFVLSPSSKLWFRLLIIFSYFSRPGNSQSATGRFVVER